jgi:hypothetical protein
MNASNEQTAREILAYIRGGKYHELDLEDWVCEFCDRVKAEAQEAHNMATREDKTAAYNAVWRKYDAVFSEAWAAVTA